MTCWLTLWSTGYRVAEAGNIDFHHSRTDTARRAGCDGSGEGGDGKNIKSDTGRREGNGSEVGESNGVRFR